jgi:hypothetical protein
MRERRGPSPAGFRSAHLTLRYPLAANEKGEKR